MKKVIILITVFAMTICLVACSNNHEDITESKNPSHSSSGQVVEPNDNATSEPDQNEHMQDENMKVVSIPGREIYIDCLSSLRTKEQGRTVIMYDSKDSLVGLTFNKSDEFVGSITDVLELLNDKFMSNISNYSKGDLDGAKIEVVSQQTSKIAGFECVKFTGTAQNDSPDGNWNCHVYGYTFVINDVPCAIIGVVSAEEQDEEMVSNIDKTVDNMAASIRTEK